MNMDMYILAGAIAIAAIIIITFIILLKHSADKDAEEDRREYEQKLNKAFEDLEYHELRRKGLTPEKNPQPEKAESTRSRAKRMIKRIRKAASNRNRKK